MRISFSELPGRHERHYRRRLDNPLFDPPAVTDGEALLEMQRLDHEELLAFIAELRQTVSRAVVLGPREETEVVLKLKEDLERLYETACGLADEQGANKQAIEYLIGTIVQTIRGNAGVDALAVQELMMEEQARALHFTLLQQPLVADLLHPESLIDREALVPTLLSESEEAVAAALALFDDAQRGDLASEARTLLASRDPERHLLEAWVRLAQFEEGLPAPN